MIDAGSSAELGAGGDRTRAEAALLEFLERRRSGEPIDFASFCAERPDLAAELEELYARYADLGLATQFEGDGDGLHLDDLRLEGGEGLAWSLAIDAGPAPEDGAPSEVVDRLGRPVSFREHYRPEGEVARGGMGVIRRMWDVRLRRLIAMKVVRPRVGKAPFDDAPSGDGPGTVDETMLARFLDEALVTSQLDHPGIVPVHDVGVDDDGSVYFTMKLVKGDDLQQLVPKVARGEDGWTLNRAVGVLRRVCEAVAYAHSKGVLHRDIKPANIMVGRYGETYLMDWGLARVIGTEIGRDSLASTEAVVSEADDVGDLDLAPDASALGPDSWLFTQDGKVVGTPVYMSPEQALGAIERVDARSDIYSLGAILYHLLSGRMPYVDPDDRPFPLLVLMAVRRGPPTPVRELAPDAPPTLLEICERAMAREPSGRYASASEMADALGDYLEDISEAREEARRQARRADMINGFLVEMLSSGEPYRAMGSEVTVREVVDRASARIASALPEQPLDEAALRRTIGVIYSQLGRHEEAEVHLERAQALLREHLDEESIEVLDTTIDLAVVMRHTGRPAASESLLRHALAILGPRHGERHPTTLRAMDNLAAAARMTGSDLAEVESLLRCAIDGRLDLHGEDHVDTICSLHGLGQFLEDRARYDEAEQVLRRALAIARRMRGEDNVVSLIVKSDLGSVLMNRGSYEEARTILESAISSLEESMPGHPHLLPLRNNLALCRKRMGDAAGALPIFERIVREYRALGPLDYKGVVALGNLGTTCEALGDLAAATAILGEAVERAAEVIGPAHRTTSRLRTHLGRCLVRHRDRRAAVAQLERALEDLRASLGDGHPWVQDVLELLAEAAG